MGVEEECETKLAGGVLSAFVQGGVEAGGGVCVRGGGVGWSRSSYVSFWAAFLAGTSLSSFWRRLQRADRISMVSSWYLSLVPS